MLGTRWWKQRLATGDNASAPALSEPATVMTNFPFPGVPGPSKLVSTEPSGFNRAMQKKVPSAPAHLPARMILPSDCNAIALARSSSLLPTTSAGTNPFVAPNVVSNVPATCARTALTHASASSPTEQNFKIARTAGMMYMMCAADRMNPDQRTTYARNLRQPGRQRTCASLTSVPRSQEATERILTGWSPSVHPQLFAEMPIQ